MSIEALKVIVGIIFAILGLAILIRLKKLSKSKYYRYLFLVTPILLIGFGIYLATNSL
jgi:threonine/homoserine/homoserine lactone efflux protein